VRWCSELVIQSLGCHSINLIECFQSVQNAAARLIFGLRRSEHTTNALVSVHWLRVPERILFKVAVLTYRAVNDSAPVYLSSYFTRVTDVPSRLRLRSSTSTGCSILQTSLLSAGLLHEGFSPENQPL